MGREKKFVQTVQVTWPRWPPHPHMVKILKKSSQEQKGWWPWKLVRCAGCSSITKFFQIMTLSWPWPILWQGQIWSLMLLYGKKINNEFFRNCCSLSYQGWEMWLTKWIYMNIKGQGHSLILVSQGEKKHMVRLGLEPRTYRMPWKHSDHWATELHGRPVTISPCLIRFVPESDQNCAGTDKTVLLLLAPTLATKCHREKKSRWPNWDLNPGTLAYSTSSLTTELPSHTVDLWHWSSVIFKFFSLVAMRPIDAKFHVDFSWDGGTNVCSNGLGHMTKMVAMPIYGKNLQKSTSLTADDLEMQHRVLKYYQVYYLGWPWPILGHGQILSLALLYGKKVKLLYSII